LNELHQLRQDHLDVYAPKQIERLHRQLGTLGAGFVVDPARHHKVLLQPLLGAGATGREASAGSLELAEALATLVGQVLVYTLRTLASVFGPQGLQRDAQHRDANEVVRLRITEKQATARDLFAAVDEKLRSRRNDFPESTDDAHAAWVANLDTFPEAQELHAAVLYAISLRAAESLALQFVNAPPKWRAHLFRCHRYPECSTPYGFDKSHRTDRSRRRCDTCRPPRSRGRRKRKVTRNRMPTAVQ
jgi:hypothetical protein